MRKGRHCLGSEAESREQALGSTGASCWCIGCCPTGRFGSSLSLFERMRCCQQARLKVRPRSAALQLFPRLEGWNLSQRRLLVCMPRLQQTVTMATALRFPAVFAPQRRHFSLVLICASGLAPKCRPSSSPSISRTAPQLPHSIRTRHPKRQRSAMVLTCLVLTSEAGRRSGTRGEQGLRRIVGMW